MTATPRTAIVTGAAKRVGARIAAGLLAEGWTVVAHAHSAGDDVPDGAVKAVAELAAQGPPNEDVGLDPYGEGAFAPPGTFTPPPPAPPTHAPPLGEGSA